MRDPEESLSPEALGALIDGILLLTGDSHTDSQGRILRG